MRDEILAFAQGQLDPAHPDGWIEMVGVGLADTMPFIASALVPGGFLLNVGSYQQENYTRLRQANPDMDRPDAIRLAAIAAPLQAVGDRIEGSL